MPLPEGPTNETNDPDSFWYKTHAWDPANSEELIKKQFQRLIAFTNDAGTELYVVNLPENELNRMRYNPEYYQRYRDLVKDSLGDVPFLDLRESIKPEDFFDVGHLTLPAAIRTTNRVIEFIKTHNRRNTASEDMEN